MVIMLLDDDFTSFPTGFEMLHLTHTLVGVVISSKGCFLFRGLGTVSVPPSIEQPLFCIINYKEYIGSDDAHTRAINSPNSLLPFQSPRVR